MSDAVRPGDARGYRPEKPGLAEALAGSALAVWLGAALLPWYGYFIDELYYVACSERLAWGYVDHPPLSILLLRISRAILGDGRLALRLPPALAGALTVWLAARLARRLGAGTLGQALAGGGVMAAPVFGAFFGFYSMNAFEPLTWLANQLARTGEGLRAGEIVMTGSLVTTRFPAETEAYAFEVSGLGSVAVTITV